MSRVQTENREFLYFIMKTNPPVLSKLPPELEVVRSCLERVLQAVEQLQLLLRSQHEDLLQQLREREVRYIILLNDTEDCDLTLPGVGMLIKLWM